MWAAVLAGVSAAWYRDPEMSVVSVTTRRREVTYWAMALATVAAGTTLADFAASPLNLGYGSSAVVFLAAVVVPVVDWCLGLKRCPRVLVGLRADLAAGRLAGGLRQPGARARWPRLR